MLSDTLDVHVGVAFRSDEYQLMGEDGAPLNYADYEIISSARATYGDTTAVINFTPEVVSALEGRFVLTATASETANLPAGFVREGAIRPLGWDMLIRAAGSVGDYTLLGKGTVHLHPTYSVVPA